MKNILLSSAAIALLAGAASAEVTWSGDAEIGYNDDVEDGFYYDAGLYLNLSQELNNGWTVSGSLDVDLESSTDDTFDMGDIDTSDWVLTIANDMFSLSFGDVDTAYASFSGVTSLYDNDLFAPADAADDYEDMYVTGVNLSNLNTAGLDYNSQGATGGVLLTFNYGSFSAAASGIIIDDYDYQFTFNDPITGDSVDAYAKNDSSNGDIKYGQAALAYDFGMFDAGLLYAEDVAYPGGEDDMIVVNLGAALAGADFNLSYMDYDAGVTGVGLDVSYPVGPVTLGAYYVSYDFDASTGVTEDDAYGLSVDYADGPITLAAYYEEVLGEEEYAVEGAYDFGMGLVVTAGYIDGDDTDDNDFASYIVAEYDLGGGASFLASYAEATNYDESGDLDDIDTGVGGYELNYGTTLALTFEF